jgi:hypothetical protein
MEGEREKWKGGGEREEDGEQIIERYVAPSPFGLGKEVGQALPTQCDCTP